MQKNKARKKVVKKKKRKKRKKYIPLGLQGKKLEILAEVPIMPCSVLSRDWQGNRYAHTQAEKVYQVYRQECLDRDLTIRRIEGRTTDCKISDRDSDGNVFERAGILFEGVWEIKDRETGETETFGGSGQGVNGVWSANSAQTVAKKQALLDYFETAWPQPTDHLKVIRESLEAVPLEDKIEAYKSILSPEAWNIMTATGAVKAMAEYFGGNQKCQRKQPKSKKRKSK